MNVGELKQFLANYPDDMEIVNGRYSDYEIIKESEWSVVRGVPEDGMVMRSHPTMSQKKTRRLKNLFSPWRVTDVNPTPRTLLGLGSHPSLPVLGDTNRYEFLGSCAELSEPRTVEYCEAEEF